MILVDRCFSEMTPESAEDGEHSDTGFLAQDEAYTFRELVRLMRDHGAASCWPASGDTCEWYSTDWDTVCYRTGTQRECSMHYSRANPERNAKYWRLAAIAAGIVKR